ncbi:MAG TPA: c-type cytochrome [Bryobacteraceae bacterium]|nr:c-type cytochrome [Bryobacteraceae bacterium]
MKIVFLFSFVIAALAADTETKVKLPNSRADMIHGEKLFQVHCARCHGPKGEGSRGPTLIRARLIHAPDDAALVAVIDDGIRGTEMPGAEAMSHHEILQTAAFVRSLGKVPQQPVPGDPARGAEIYRTKGNCGACHSISGEGGVAGPDLTQIGEARSPAYLRESIVDPQAAVPEGYVRLTVVSKAGRSVTGVRVNEDSFSIQVRDDSGRSFSFWKSDVARVDKPQNKSPMPSFRGQLSDPELTDLVAYLASLKERK